MTKQTQTTNTAAAALPESEVVYFTQAGTAYGQSSLAEGRRDQELGEHLKTACASYEAWNAARTAFVAAAAGAGYLASGKLWERTIARLQDLGLVGDAPKSTSAAAVKKAEQRAKSAELPKGSAESWRKQAVALLADGKTKEAEQAVTNARKIERAADKAAADKANAETLESALVIRAALEVLRSKGDAKSLAGIAAAAEKAARKASAADFEAALKAKRDAHAKAHAAK